MENYQSNSFKSKEAGEKTELPEKKIEKVVVGEVISKRKSGLMKITDSLIQEDIGSIKSYIFSDVLIPNIKKLIRETVTNGIDMLLYGSTGKGKSGSSTSNIQYHRVGSEPSRRFNTTSTYDFNDVILSSRSEAEEVLRAMEELIDVYRWCSVADFYDLVGVSGTYTDNKYGWSSVRSASVERTYNGGFRIRLPKAMPID